jgi:hypothetical protein
MGMIELLTTVLAVPLAKFLLKNYLGDTGESFGSGLLDIAQNKIKDYGAQRDAQREFERIADRIVNRLSPLFETAERTVNIKTEAVACELAKTLEHRISAEFFINRDLDPKLLASAFRAARPLPRGMFSSDEVELYERGLDETIRYVVEVATALPKFESVFAAGSLRRLTLISKDVEQVLETVQRVEQQVSLRVDDGKARRYEADYRQAIIRNLDYVELFGADISQESRRQTLSVAYLSLDLQTSSAASADTPEVLSAELVLASLTPEAGRLLICGEAGSGKSTLFRWIALKAAGLTLDGRHDFFSSYSSFRGSLSGSYKWLRAISDKRSSEFAREILPPITAATASMEPMLSPSWEEFLVNTRSLLAYRNREVSRPPSGAGLKAYGAALSSLLKAEWNWCDRIPFLIRLRDCGSAELPPPEEFPRFVAKEPSLPM